MPGRRPMAGFFAAGLVVLLAGCGSSPAGRADGAEGPAPGFARVLGATTCILPTVHAPGIGRGLPAPVAVGDALAAELLVARMGGVVGPRELPASLADGRLRRLAVAFARGERTVPADFEPLRGLLPSPFALVSWVDEQVVEGRENVRTDVEPDDLRAAEGLAGYRAVEGVVHGHLVDLATGDVLWTGSAPYATPRDYDATVDASALERARVLGAVDLARALEADAVAASD